MNVPENRSIEWVIPENRSIEWVKDADLIPRAEYYDIPLVDDADMMQNYFGKFRSFAAGCDLAFFDADKGLEITSTRYGLKGSSQYLYENELVKTYEAGLSVLVYQHFHRVEHTSFLQREAPRLRALTSVAEVIAFRTSFTSFLLVPQPRHLAYLRARSEYIKDVWPQLESKRRWIPYMRVVSHMENE
jgi:hypothetical protein